MFRQVSKYCGNFRQSKVFLCLVTNFAGFYSPKVGVWARRIESALATDEDIVRCFHPDHVRHAAEPFFQLDRLETAAQVGQMVRRQEDVVPAEPRWPEAAAEARMSDLARRPLARHVE